MRRAADACDRLVDGGIAALVLLTPLAFGSVETWAVILLRISLFAIAALWLIARGLKRSSSGLSWGAAETGSPAGGEVPESRPVPSGAGRSTGMEAAMVLFMAVVLLQLVPVPRAIVSVLSPRASSLYERTVPGYAQSADAGFEEWLLASDAARTEIAPAGDRPSPAVPLSYAPPATRDRLALFFAYALLFIVAADRFRSPARRRRMITWIAFVGVGIAIQAIFQKLTWNGLILWFRAAGSGTRPFGPFVNPNHFAGYMELIVPLALGLLLTLLWRPLPDELRLDDRGRQSERRARMPWTATNPLPKAVLLGFLLTLSLASIVLSLSRGGFLATLLTLALFSRPLVRALSLTRSRTAMLSGTVAVAVIALGVVFWIGASSIAARATTLAGMRSEPSFLGRVHAWGRTVDLFRDHLVIGAGLGGYETAYSGYYPPGTYAIWREAHNDYLQLLAEVGVAGIIPALLALSIFLRAYFFPSILARGRPDYYLTLGLAMAIVSMLLHTVVDFNLQIPAVGFLFVLIGGLLVASWRGHVEAPQQTPAAGKGGRSLMLLAAAGMLVVVAVQAVAGARRVLAEQAVAMARRQGSNEAAERLFDRALALTPGQPAVLSAAGDDMIAAYDVWRLEGGRDLGEGERRLARTAGIFRHLVTITPLSAWGWWGLGQVHARRSELRRGQEPIEIESLIPGDEKDLVREARLALAAYRTALLLEPNAYQIHDDVAYLYQSEGLRPAALAAFQHGARIMPLYAQHDYGPATALAEDVYRAISAGMEEALQAPEVADAVLVRQCLGEMASYRGDLAAGELHFRRGLDIARSALMEGVHSYLLGDVLRRQGRLDEAEPLLLRGTQTPAVGVVSWTALARLKISRGDHSGAKQALIEAISLGPADDLPEMMLAEEMARSGNPAAAISRLRSLVVNRPPALDAREMLVRFLRDAGQIEEARAEARQLLALAPHRESARRLLAEVERAAGSSPGEEPFL